MINVTLLWKLRFFVYNCLCLKFLWKLLMLVWLQNILFRWIICIYIFFEILCPIFENIRYNFHLIKFGLWNTITRMIFHSLTHPISNFESHFQSLFSKILPNYKFLKSNLNYIANMNRSFHPTRRNFQNNLAKSLSFLLFLIFFDRNR